MRIAVVTNAFPPEARGGAGQIASDLVDVWRGSGDEVRVWTSRAAWTYGGVITRLLGHLVLERRLPAYAQELEAWCPDVVVTHNLTGAGLLRIGRWLNSQAMPWIHVLHDAQLFEPSGLVMHDRATWWQRGWSWYRRALFGVPSLVVSPTQWLLEAHERRGWFADVASQVVPNPAPAAGRIRESELSHAWVFVGRLDASKGADFLLDVARACPNERFTVIGEGVLRGEFERLSNVRCLGQRSRQEVLEAMTSSRGVLVPSRVQENQPTVILEAFTCGVPVVASCVGGIPETVGGGGVCLPLDAPAWSAVLKRSALFWDELRLGVERERERFSAPAVVRGWQGVFSRVTVDQRQRRLRDRHQTKQNDLRV